jgi:GT2 family glycosyltransferase
MIDKNLVTIIIPHYGASSEMCYALKQTRGSLYETTPDIQMLVIKNGDIQCHCLYDIKVKAQGQCKAVNAAIATINTPWVMITNDDMVYPPHWWEDLTDNIFMESCISPQLVEPLSGAPTFEVYFCGGAGGDFDKQKFLTYVKAQNVLPRHGMRDGFNFPVLLRRELWDTVGGYDINYDPFGSNGDSDLQYKIMLAGIQPKQNQNCLVYHFSQTSGTFEPQNDSYRFKNYAYFKQKWGFDRTDDRIWESDFRVPTKEQGRIYFPEFEGRYE